MPVSVVVIFSLLLLCLGIQLVSSAPAEQFTFQQGGDDIFENDENNDFESISPSLESTMARLLYSVQQSQARETVDYAPRNTYPPLLHWYRQRGIYDSFVHLNFHGNWPSRALLRNGYRFPDDNAFVTLFVTHALLETYELAAANMKDLDFVEKRSLVDAIEAINAHRDKNTNGSVPVYAFWNQRRVSASADGGLNYGCSPPNILIPLADAGNGLRMIQRGVARLNITNVDNILRAVIGFDTIFQKVFQIPPDSDDTGCSLALGMKLKQLSERETLQDSPIRIAYAQWISENADPKGRIFSFFLKYAYRPFSGDYASSSIDPRTYFWIRGFLQEERERQNNTVPSLALFTTWMQSIPEVAQQINYQKMPFNLNNVDGSVVVNALYGVTSVLLMQTNEYAPLFDQSMREMYADNIRLLQWILKNRVVERYPTMILLYYPPKFAFYWFMARLVHMLNDDRLVQPLASNYPEAYAVLIAARDSLTESMKSYGTKEILRESACDNSYCFWDDFLGNADHLKNNKTIIPMHEDRVFSTSMALNALIDTWTVRRNTSGVVWLSLRDDIDPELEFIIQRAVAWTIERSHRFPKENAFFSGSIKTSTDNPYNFPHNTFRHVNGMDLGKCSNYNSSSELGLRTLGMISAAMTGVVSEADYQKMIREQRCFGQPVPIAAVGKSLNCDGCVYPYWSSPPLTNSMTLLALAKYQASDLLQKK